MTIIKLLLVDDHRILLAGISSSLGKYKDIKIVGQAISGEEGVKLAKIYQPDIVLMDIKMEGMDGLSATKKILSARPRTRIIIFTACESDFFPMRLLKAGAFGYITKNCATNEIAQAIRSVHAGERYITPNVAKKLALSKLPLQKENPFDVLSQRELQVVTMITSQAKKVIQIADELDLHPKTINTYRYRIFDKLGIDNDVKLTHLAWHYGLINPLKKTKNEQ